MGKGQIHYIEVESKSEEGEEKIRSDQQQAVTQRRRSTGSGAASKETPAIGRAAREGGDKTS
jgi:hypothetical protein